MPWTAGAQQCNSDINASRQASPSSKRITTPGESEEAYGDYDAARSPSHE